MAKIVFLNQGGGLLMKDIVLSCASFFGEVTYYCSDNIPSSVEVKKVIMPSYERGNIISRLYSWLSYLVRASIKMFDEPNKPLLFIVTNPPISPLLGVIMKKIKGQRYILLFYDIYPEALIPFAGISKKSPLIFAWKVMNRFAIQNADKVITITPGLAKVLYQYQTKKNPLKIEIIPTWVDTEFIKPIPKKENWFAKQHNQVDKLTVLYSGNMGAMHDLSMIPQIAQRLQTNKDIHFLLIGDGFGRSRIELECKRMGLKNITLLPFQKEEVIPFSLATGDISIVAIADGYDGIAMPSKTYFSMAAGSALMGLSNPNSELAEIINRYQCGINVIPKDVEGIAQAIIQLKSNPSLLQQYRENSRKAAVQNFSRSKCVAQLVEIIKKILI